MIKMNEPEIVNVKMINHVASSEYYVMFESEFNLETWIPVSEKDYYIAAYILNSKRYK